MGQIDKINEKEVVRTRGKFKSESQDQGEQGI